MAAPTNMFSKHPDMDTGQAWASKTTHMSGGWTWDHLKLTHMRIMCIELHPSRLIRKGCALCRRPRKKQIAFEFKFTVKLKLEFDFDFDLISGSNFNKMGVKVVQISTYHFQI